MPHKLRSQAGFLEQGSLKREDAHHQIQHAHHLGNAPAMPCPHLRGDKINDFGVGTTLADPLRQPQIEPRIINQNKAIRLVLPYPLQNGEKTPSEPSVFFEHLIKCLQTFNRLQGTLVIHLHFRTFQILCPFDKIRKP